MAGETKGLYATQIFLTSGGQYIDKNGTPTGTHQLVASGLEIAQIACSRYDNMIVAISFSPQIVVEN